MGYLDNSSITVDAILTKKGRELLAQGSNQFRITQFALGDDEVDYSLWNPDHPLGTDYYGVIIENLPIVEAIPDETQALRSKLITLPRSSQRIPVISANPVTITAEGGSKTNITPNTANMPSLNTTYGYTCVLSDNTVGTIRAKTTLSNPALAPSVASFIGTNNQSVAVVGLEFEFVAQVNKIKNMQATITIVGNESGGSVTIPVTVKKFIA
jgi:hypothetical protein